MAPRAKVDAGRLVALGAERLAALLVELAKGDPTIRRRLAVELAGEEGAEAMAATIAERLATIARSRSFLDGDGVRALATELEQLRTTVRERVASTRPDLATDLSWQLLEAGPSLLERADDGSGRLGAVLEGALSDLAATAPTATPRALADRLFGLLQGDTFGATDGAVPILASALGESGLARLRERLDKALALPGGRDPGEYRHWQLRASLKAVMLAQGDLDSWIGSMSPEQRSLPQQAAEIGRRLLAAGRAAEALAVLEAADGPRPEEDDRSDLALSPRDRLLLRLERELDGQEADDREEVLIEALAATGQMERAQARRWEGFERTLSVRRLRAFLGQLPDFEDFLAERRAKELALAHADVHAALVFFVEWPDLALAARLVLERRGEIDGDLYMILTPAAERLEEKEPLAATLLYRAMILDGLEHGRTSRYKHLARHLHRCAGLDAAIADRGDVPDHAAFVEALRADHGRKHGFWDLAAAPPAKRRRTRARA